MANIRLLVSLNTQKNRAFVMMLNYILLTKIKLKLQIPFSERLKRELADDKLMSSGVNKVSELNDA